MTLWLIRIGIVAAICAVLEWARRKAEDETIAEWDGRYSLAEPLPRSVVLEPDDLDGGWIATDAAAAGCVGQGDTRDEAVRDLDDAIAAVSDLMARREQR